VLREAAAALQYPRATVLFTRWRLRGKRAAARVGGVGNAGRGASPTADKREGISF